MVADLEMFIVKMSFDAYLPLTERALGHFFRGITAVHKGRTATWGAVKRPEDYTCASCACVVVIIMNITNQTANFC